jgi:signal transduction histidine kinase/DNA-binding response OmpR family regulator
MRAGGTDGAATTAASAASAASAAPASIAAPIRPGWLGLVGLVLLLALIGVALVQARQFTPLRAAVQPADDLGALAVVQAESQQLRLAAVWQAALQPQAGLGRASDLRQSYAEWRDSLESLQSDATRKLMGTAPGYAATLNQLNTFKDRVDAVLGSAPAQSGPPSREALAALLEQLQPLQTPMRQLAREAPQRLVAHMEIRSQAVRSQTRIGLVLTAFLALLTLAFAALALSQLRSLRERRAELEVLASSLRLARRDAEAASQAKSTFLANMSHEIRTPFHGLMGMLSLLREAGLNPRQIDYLRTATESADHLLALLNDVLDMSQLESGQLSLTPAPVSLRALLRDVEALMRPQAAAKDLALHFDADPSVPERMLLDATRVRQIVFNLLSNAIKFSERGAVVLDVRCRNADEPSQQARLEFVVTDTGVGMDEATQARLFHRFMQGDSSRQRRHGGSGLGLEISRNLARLMNGDITVRSKPGEGSTFTFWMPLRAAPDTNSHETDSAPANVGLARPLRVLVAEDHPVNRQYLAALLENQGHSAHFTANGEEAVRAVREQRFDVVLMDLHMPVMDGVDAARAIRALGDASSSTMPIVALTADVFPETHDRCMAAGMNDYLTKPVSPQGLATCLRRLFGSTGVAPPADVAVMPGVQSQHLLTDSQLLDPHVMALSLQVMSVADLSKLVYAYIEQGPATVQRLRVAVRDAQPLELRVHAHATKGAALNLGLVGLAATAQALHGGAAHLPAHEIARLVQRFETQLAATREQLPAALQTAQALAEAGAQTMTGSGSSRMPKRP